MIFFFLNVGCTKYLNFTKCNYYDFSSVKTIAYLVGTIYDKTKTVK